MNEESGLIAPKPKRRFDVFLFFCRLLNVITSVSSLLCLVAHGMAIVVGPSIFQVHKQATAKILQCILV